MYQGTQKNCVPSMERRSGSVDPQCRFDPALSLHFQILDLSHMFMSWRTKDATNRSSTKPPTDDDDAVILQGSTRNSAPPGQFPTRSSPKQRSTSGRGALGRLGRARTRLPHWSRGLGRLRLHLTPALPFKCLPTGARRAFGS